MGGEEREACASSARKARGGVAGKVEGFQAQEQKEEGRRKAREEGEVKREAKACVNEVASAERQRKAEMLL